MSTAGGLSLTQMTSVVRGALPSVKKRFNETQKLNRFVAQREFIQGAEEKDPSGGTYGWSVRLRSAAGSTGGIRAFQASSYLKAYYTERATVPFITTSNKSMAFDRIEMGFNRNSRNKLFDLIEDAYSAGREDMAVTDERMIFGRRENATDDLQISGLMELFPPSADSSGAYVADPVGGYNGTTIVYGDGSVASTYAGVDASPIANERHRGWVGTYSVMDLDTAALIKRAMDELQFDPLPALKGEMPEDDLVLFMDPENKQKYDALASLGPDPRNGDVFPFRKYTLNGTRIVSVSQLRSDTTGSIYGIRKSLVKVIKAQGMWMIEGEDIVPGAHNTKVMPVDYTWQFVNLNRQLAGFRLHRAF